MYEIDKKTQGRIYNALRRLTYSYPPNAEVRRRNKIDKALFCCEECKRYCYEGKSKRNFAVLVTKYPNNTVIMEKCEVDHIDPIIPIQTGWKWDWNDIIRRMFCSIKNLKLLCKSCHKGKTSGESTERAVIRKSSKK